MASSDPMLLEGAHASEILVVFDEGKAIPNATYDALEGAFASGSAYGLVISTPGAPVGRFYDICTQKAGLESWYVRHIRTQEALDAGRVNQEWVEQCKALWGEESAIYRNRVRGEFAADEIAGVIPLSWVEAANLRWLDGHDEGLITHLGVDVASAAGGDRTVVAVRRRMRVSELASWVGQSTMGTAGKLKALLQANPGAKAIVDVIGVGTGLVERLKEQEVAVEGYNGAERVTVKDRTGTWAFTNRRTWAYWNLRELLDPESGANIDLPPHDKLLGDLTAPTWKLVSGGKIQLEKKEQVVKKLGRSPDFGDAVVMAFAESGRLGWLEYLQKQIDNEEKKNEAS